MRDELLAYLLNDLEPEQRQRVEARIKSDPIWQHELQRLRTYIQAAESDPTEADELPPTDLVDSTCSFVKKATSHGDTEAVLPQAALSESPDLAAPKSSRWSFVDIAVAAGILLAIGTLLLPALRESREAARRIQCQEKLRHLGTAIAGYAERFQGELPNTKPNENVGLFVVKLADHGLLTREQLAELLVCPSSPLADEVFSGSIVLRIPTQQEFAAMAKAKRNKLSKYLAGSFAYRIGYVDPQGNYHQVRYVGRSNSPMMSDAPSYSIIGFQSANHRGTGQNVLFQDLSTRYVQHCLKSCEQDHLFLNEDDQHAAGRHPQDVVLGRSEIMPLAEIAAQR